MLRQESVRNNRNVQIIEVLSKEFIIIQSITHTTIEYSVHNYDGL